jgi:hypothetical protein
LFVLRGNFLPERVKVDFIEERVSAVRADN